MTSIVNSLHVYKTKIVIFRDERVRCGPALGQKIGVVIASCTWCIYYVCIWKSLSVSQTVTYLIPRWFFRRTNTKRHAKTLDNTRRSHHEGLKAMPLSERFHLNEVSWNRKSPALKKNNLHHKDRHSLEEG